MPEYQFRKLGMTVSAVIAFVCFVDPSRPTPDFWVWSGHGVPTNWISGVGRDSPPKLEIGCTLRAATALQDFDNKPKEGNRKLSNFFRNGALKTFTAHATDCLKDADHESTYYDNTIIL